MSKSFYEHDNRAHPGTSRFFNRGSVPNISRGSLQNSNRGSLQNINRMGRRNNNFRKFGGRGYPDLDGDIEMTGSHGSGGRYTPYRGAKKFNIGSRGRHQRRLARDSYRHTMDHDLFSWYKITIPYGKKLGKEFILKALNSMCNSPLIPYNFQMIGQAAEFYLNDHVASRQVKECNRRISTPDGSKMAVQSMRCPTPNCIMDDEVMDVLKNCMSARYDSITHVLNLEKFQDDEMLKQHGLYLALNRPPVMGSVGRVIKDHIPELEVLKCGNNKISTLEKLGIIVPVCKQLRALYFNQNKIRNFREFNSLKGLNIVEINLDGNPFCDNFKDKPSYISAVRDIFPKVISLDNQELPPPIGFDLGPETLPASKKNSCVSEEVVGLVVQFLEQYYLVYDSGDRTKLLDAYHDQANFSLSLGMVSYHKPEANSLSSMYGADNRNLLRVSDTNRRVKLLKQGKLSIVTFLSELPQTMHDASSFSIDIFHVSPGLMCFSTTGIFKEVGADINNVTVKTFNRTFVVVLQGQSIVITNETLFIAVASEDQKSKAFKVPAPTPSPSPAPPLTEERSPAEKQAMVLELSKQTRMTIDFSTKCLEEHDWDFQRAYAVFVKVHSEGKLPPDAFLS